jgi:hypothetical protein
VNTFIEDYGWLLVFWGTLILLGAVEYLAPETPGDCDEHLDATSTLRNHPLELIASAVFVGAIVAISGLSPAVLIVYESIEALLNLLAHANVRLPQPAERVARALFFITPPCIAFIVPRGRKKRTATTAPCFRSGIICSAPIGTRLPNSRPFASDWTRSVANRAKPRSSIGAALAILAIYLSGDRPRRAATSSTTAPACCSLTTRPPRGRRPAALSRL